MSGSFKLHMVCLLVGGAVHCAAVSGCTKGNWQEDDKAASLDPKEKTDYFYRGNAKFTKQDYDGAISDYDEAIRLDPKMVGAYYNRGITKFNKQDYDAAIKDFDEAIRLNPNVAPPYFDRGLAKSKNQDYDGAIIDYDAAIKLDPKYAKAYRNRGIAKSDKQDYNGAIADLDDAIRLDPKNAFAYFNRGSVKLRKQEYDGAVNDYNEAIRLDPKFANAHFNRAVSQLLMRRADATESFQSVIDVEGGQSTLATKALVLGCLSGRLMQQPERAARYLTDAKGKLLQGTLYPVFKYLREDLDEAGLLAIATDTDKLTEAHCYIGLNQLAKGDAAVAQTHLEWVRDHGNRNITEYEIAIAELRRLEGKAEK